MKTKPCVITTSWNGAPITPCRRLRANEKIRHGDTFNFDFRRPHCEPCTCIINASDTSAYWIGWTVANTRLKNPGINYFRKV